MLSGADAGFTYTRLHTLEIAYNVAHTAGERTIRTVRSVTCLALIRTCLKSSRLGLFSVAIALGLCSSSNMSSNASSNTESISSILSISINSVSHSDSVVPARGYSVVKVDPQTGELRFEPSTGKTSSLPLTPELESSLNRSASGLQITTGAGGGKMVDLRGRFRTLNIVRNSESGLTVECVESKGGVK